MSIAITDETARNLAEELHEHSDVLLERNHLDREAAKRGRPRWRRGLRFAAAVAVVSAVPSLIAARAVSAANQSQAELVKARQDFDTATRNAYQNAENRLARCLHADLTEVLGGGKADPTCNPPTAP